MRASYLMWVATVAILASAPANLAMAQSTVPVQSPASVQSANLPVKLTGLRSAKGQVLVWVWNGPDGFPGQESKCFRYYATDASRAADGSVNTTFSVPPGSYGVTALHDENSNGKMDTNFLGIPTEGIGTSNNVVSHFRAPSFQQVSFTVPASGQQIAIALRY